MKDMGGNVSEWVAGNYRILLGRRYQIRVPILVRGSWRHTLLAGRVETCQRGPLCQVKVVKGASWQDGINRARIDHRTPVLSFRWPGAGIRCVR